MKSNFEKIIIIILLLVPAAAWFLPGLTDAASIESKIRVSSEASSENGTATAKSTVETQLSGNDSGQVSTDVNVQANDAKKEVHTQDAGHVSVEVKDDVGSVQAENSSIKKEGVEQSEKQDSEAKAPEENNPYPVATSSEESRRFGAFFSKTENFFRSIADWLKNIL